MPFLSIEQVAAATGADSSQHAQIGELIPKVLGTIEHLTGRWFTERATTEIVRSRAAPALFLRRYPVASITSITDRVTGEAVAAEGYILESASGIVNRLPYGDCWLDDPSPSAARYSVVYTGGFAAAPIDIQLAAIDMIALDLRGQGGLSEETEGDYSYKLEGRGDDGLTSRARAVLARYAQAPV